MALKVTGDILFNDIKYPNPQINLVPHLEIYGKISMDAYLLVNNNLKTTIGYENIDRSLLEYSDEIKDGYVNLIKALENYVKNDLLKTNPDLKIESYTPKPEVIIPNVEIQNVITE